MFRALAHRERVAGTNLCRMCGIHKETAERAILQCMVHEPTVALRGGLLHRCRDEGLQVSTRPFSDDDAKGLLRTLVNHWSLVVPTEAMVSKVRVVSSPFSTNREDQMQGDEDEDEGESDRTDSTYTVAGTDLFFACGCRFVFEAPLCLTSGSVGHRLRTYIYI